MKATTTRTTGPANSKLETKEDESSSSYVSTDVAKGKGEKKFDVNSVDDVDENEE